MHAMHTDPRRVLIAAMGALVMVILAMTMINALGNIDLGIRTDQAPVSAPAPASTARTGTPAWVVNPTASPLGELRTP